MTPRPLTSAFVLFLGAGAFIAPVVRAQAPTALDSSRYAIHAALKRVRPTTSMRVIMRHGERFAGQYAGSTDSTLRLRNFRTDVPLAGVDSVWVRGSAAGRGALIGAVVGGVLTGAALAGLESAICDGEACGVGTAFVHGALGGAAAGAFLGVLVGSVIPRWRLRFP